MGGQDRKPWPADDGGSLKQSGIAEPASASRWPAWLAVHDQLPAPLRQVPFALFVLGILAYGAIFAWYMLTRFDLVNLLREVNYYDDAFYYFQIAYHMAEGRFSTFDGGVTRTNGYHPLWALLLTPFYWLFDKTEALFAVKAFEIMLVAGGVALVPPQRAWRVCRGSCCSPPCRRSTRSAACCWGWRPPSYCSCWGC